MKAKEYVERYQQKLMSDNREEYVDALAGIAEELLAEIKYISQTRYKMYGDNVHLSVVKEIFDKSVAIARIANKISPRWEIKSDWLSCHLPKMIELLKERDAVYQHIKRLREHAR